jgi:hypothetical protein
MGSKLLICLVATAFSVPGPGTATEGRITDSEMTVEPADVFVHVAVVRQELELIRLEMGKPEDMVELINLANVAPREVFFQALSLFRSANRLCYEHTRTDVPEPVAPTDAVHPQHVFGVVDTALKQIRKVKEQLNIVERVQQPRRDNSRTPTDVFGSLLMASQQLNVLLDQEFKPSDVFEQVTLSVSLASRLLARFPDTVRIPTEPPYERRKRPADVHDRLIECFQVLQSIATLSGIEIATLTRSEREQRVKPGDVYSIAALVVSELVHLHAQIEESIPPVQTYYPGRKLPSDVYQRAGILLSQLHSLEKQVRAHPRWLDTGKTSQ